FGCVSCLPPWPPCENIHATTSKLPAQNLRRRCKPLRFGEPFPTPGNSTTKRNRKAIWSTCDAQTTRAGSRCWATPCSPIAIGSTAWSGPTSISRPKKFACSPCAVANRINNLCSVNIPIYFQNDGFVKHRPEPPTDSRQRRQVTPMYWHLAVKNDSQK